LALPNSRHSFTRPDIKLAHFSSSMILREGSNAGMHPAG
jgi:hypothetical protein